MQYCGADLFGFGFIVAYFEKSIFIIPILVTFKS